MCILILKEDGHLIAARDRLGRLPVLIGKDEDGYCVSFESFAFRKLEYIACQELKPAEIVEITPERVTVLAEGQEEMRICAFLWTYYGYPNSYYEGINVEVMRNRNGALLAKRDSEVGHSMKLDYVSGVPDSGTPHAIGYANTSGIPFARPFIKYTPTWPRSFMPQNQSQRNLIAKMKLIPVGALIKDKSLLLIDDSIVRGTTCRRTIDLLRRAGAKEIHMRVSAPPFVAACYYGTDIDDPSKLIANNHSVEEIAKIIGVDSLGYLSLQDVVKLADNTQCGFCTACFGGGYPTAVPQDGGKDRFECKISERERT